jgi:hypothetical protein
MIRFAQPFSNIRFDEDKRYGEDIFYFMDFAYNSSSPFLHLSIIGSCMRLHVESAAQDRKAQAAHAKDISNLMLGLDITRLGYADDLKKKNKRRKFFRNRCARNLWNFTRKPRALFFRFIHLMASKLRILKYLRESKLSLLVKEFLLK